VKNHLSLKRVGAAALLAFGATLFCCPGSAIAAARFNIQSGATVRSAVVVEHERLKLRRRPLVIILHPTGIVGRGHRHHRLEELAESNKPVFLYPDPLNGEWPVAAGPDADRDVRFLRDLVDRFIGEGTVDPRKIYLIGEASGGVFAYRAACAGIGRSVAGLAALGAAMPADLGNCAANPMAYMAVSRVGDPRIPFAGGPATLGNASFEALPAETTLSIFAKISACAGKREDKPLPGAPHAPKGMILSYSGCKAPVELVRLEGTGLKVSSHLHDNEPLNEDGPEFDTARRVWDFLKRNGA
jgi:polyhydroxybutyrate depolymerase